MTTKPRLALDILLFALWIGHGIVGLWQHSTFHLAAACLFFLLAERVS